MNSDTCWIRVDRQIRFENGYVWTWKFLNPERKSCGLKNIGIRVNEAKRPFKAATFKNKRLLNF